MTNRRNFLLKGGAGVAAIALSQNTYAETILSSSTTGNYVSKRPEIAQRKFTSQSVEATITRIKAQIKDPKLAWLFENCYPNTLDTTVNYKLSDNKPDTFVVTGDINALWLRDSSAQVWPYLSQINQDEPLRLLIAGVVNRQTKCVNIDPYANSFNEGPTGSEWKTDQTAMKPELHERKWEIDSLCYTVRLAYNYWKTCGDTSVFSPEWKNAAALIVKTFKEQQRKKDNGPYSFLRVTDRQFDTLSNNGLGMAKFMRSRLTGLAMPFLWTMPTFRAFWDCLIWEVFRPTIRFTRIPENWFGVRTIPISSRAKLPKGLVVRTSVMT